MLRKEELEAYVRSRQEGYPDDEAKVRGLVASNLISLYEQVTDATTRKHEARTEVEAIEADKNFVKHRLALEDNWSGFKHLFEPEKFNYSKPSLYDPKAQHIVDIEHQISVIERHLVAIRLTLRELQ